jgi:release factor glutamine methyltransferase
MLARILCREESLRGSAVLDLCTGSGVLAVAAARGGAAEVTAVDVSRRSVLAARANAAINRVCVRVLRGNLFEPVTGRRFDTIVSNPPYVPAASGELPSSGPERAWEAGLDGRAVLDRVIAGAPAHLRPGGALLLVHSSICGADRTLEALAGAGLEAEVRARHRGPLGPLLKERVGLLEERALLAPGKREEELLALRARAPE